MGLDMYLYKNTYIGNQYRSPEQIVTLNIPNNQEGVIFPIKKNQIKSERISSIEENVAYWRKANHIHNWFVENVQEGEDDCKKYYVSREQIQELIDLCKQVLDNKEKAEELLPTQSGFFFGGTEYDEWYFQDLEDTIKQLTPLLEETEGDFYYQSSW